MFCILLNCLEKWGKIYENWEIPMKSICIFQDFSIHHDTVSMWYPILEIFDSELLDCDAAGVTGLKRPNYRKTIFIRL